jgi:hypothetical protein
VNGTGTGTFTFNIIDPKNETTGDLYWFEAKKPGKYSERLGIKTFTVSNCNPSTGRKIDPFFHNRFSNFSSIFLTGLCDDFPVGTYNVTAQICNGECGSHHPHTAIYDVGASSFVVTKKQ